MRQNLGDYRCAATAYKRAIAEAPAADLGLLEVQLPGYPVLDGGPDKLSCLQTPVMRSH